MDNRIVVAIDGYSSCGKSTMAKALAQQVGYIYVDTGAMYRAVALAALRQGIITDTSIDEVALETLLPELDVHFELNQEGLPEIYLGDERVEGEIRTMTIASYTSRISALPSVRQAMTRLQQSMGQQGGIVMDGRDIGTAVFPNAELKVFVTADPKVRAERRFLELQTKGDTSLTLEEVQRGIEERDYNDSHRAISPLRQAEDALVLDNSYMNREEQMKVLVDMFDQAIRRQG